MLHQRSFLRAWYLQEARHLSCAMVIVWEIYVGHHYNQACKFAQSKAILQTHTRTHKQYAMARKQMLTRRQTKALTFPGSDRLMSEVIILKTQFNEGVILHPVPIITPIILVLFAG